MKLFLISMLLFWCRSCYAALPEQCYSILHFTFVWLSSWMLKSIFSELRIFIRIYINDLFRFYEKVFAYFQCKIPTISDRLMLNSSMEFPFSMKRTSLTFRWRMAVQSPGSDYLNYSTNVRNLNEIKFHKHFIWDSPLGMVNNGNYFFTLLFCCLLFSL